MWTDTHAHLEGFITCGEIETILARAVAARVNRIVAIGGHPEANAAALDLAARYPGRIVAAIGYDRYLAADPPSPEVLQVELARSRAVAVGEIGLDYYHEIHTAPDQRRLFRAMLDLAAAHRLPVVLHTRAAERDTLKALKAHAQDARVRLDRIGVAHCFTGDWTFARALLDLGFYLGISGIVTFRNAEILRDVVRRAPADRLLLETDCPYLAPVPMRGKRNEPAFLTHTGICVAELRGCAPEEWACITSENAARLFGLAPAE